MHKGTGKEVSHIKDSYKGSSITGEGQVNQRKKMKLRGNVKVMKYREKKESLHPVDV